MLLLLSMAHFNLLPWFLDWLSMSWCSHSASEMQTQNNDPKVLEITEKLLNFRSMMSSDTAQFLFLSCSVLESYTFPKLCPFLSGHPLYNIVLHSSLMIHCISVVSVVKSPFSFIIIFIWLFFLLFLISLAKSLIIWVIFSKNQFFFFLPIFSIIFLSSVSFISALVFVPSFC